MYGLPVHAGFGISPPYVQSDKLTPGAHYEQRINLLRSSADSVLVANLIVDAPEIESWISFDKGIEFELPKNVYRVPMIVIVDVPDDANLGVYSGKINIRVSPKLDRGGGGVAIALGARIDVNLSVTDESILGFKVRATDFKNFEELGFPWNLKLFSYFFYRVRVGLKLENLGNEPIAPTKIEIDILDISQNKKLESSVNRRLKKVEPYKISDIVATFPTNLDSGQYWMKVRVYDEERIVYNPAGAFTIFEKGQMPGGPPDLGMWPWLMLGGCIALFIIFIYIFIRFKLWQYIFLMLYVVIGIPISFVSKKIINIITKIKLKFWEWAGKKAAKHTNPDQQNKKPPRN